MSGVCPGVGSNVRGRGGGGGGGNGGSLGGVGGSPRSSWVDPNTDQSNCRSLMNSIRSI